MKLKTYIFLAAIFFSMSCQQREGQVREINNQNQSNDNIKLEETKGNLNFIKIFEGTIDSKYPIIAKLNFQDGKITGNYYYKKIKQELELNGEYSKDGNVELKEFDNLGKQTGTFIGKLTNERKITGTWENSTRTKAMPFYLIASNANYDIKPKQTNQTTTVLPAIPDADKIKIIYIEKELIVNKDYLKTADESVKAILAYYSAKVGTACWWENGNANENYSNLVCLLTEALGLGYQCSEKHKEIVKKWFATETKIIEQVDGCFSVPHTATSYSDLSMLNIAINGNFVTVETLEEGHNIRNESFWKVKGFDKFEIIGKKIKVISQKENAEIHE